MENLTTYEPAWGYYRHGWTRDTGVAWDHTKHGDELRLWLPVELVGITVHDDRGLEGLAWQEERLGALPRTWTTRPTKARFGTSIYTVPPCHLIEPTITYGVTIGRDAIPVWPTPTDDLGRYAWHDPIGVPLLGSPKMAFPELPKLWREELTSLAGDGFTGHSVTIEDTFRSFLSQTFIPNGNEYRLTSEEIFGIYTRWLDSSDMPDAFRANEIHLMRWISTSAQFQRWAGRTSLGYRRGFTGLRFPDGEWND